MWAQSFDCHVEVTWIGQSFTENGDSFATITNIWEAKKMWLLCRMSWWLAFSLFFPRFKQPLLSPSLSRTDLFKLPSQASSSSKLRVWDSSIKSTCHVTSRSEFQRDPLTLNGLRDSGSMLCPLHRQTKKSFIAPALSSTRNTKRVVVHWSLVVDMFLSSQSVLI